jgi:hypothetical protein
MRYWEIIADNLSKADWSWGCVSAIDSRGRIIWIADAHRGDGKRFVARADEKLTAFLELELPIRVCGESCLTSGRISFKTWCRQTDSNQAEEISPARFFASSGPAIAE